MIFQRDLQRLKIRDATVFKLRVPSFVNDSGYQVPEFVDHHMSRAAAMTQALMFEHRGPLGMPVPEITPVKARRL